MNVPVALRDIKPTSWWNDDKNNLTTIEPVVHVANSKHKDKHHRHKKNQLDETSSTITISSSQASSDIVNQNTYENDMSDMYHIPKSSQLTGLVDTDFDKEEEIVVIAHPPSMKSSSI